METASFTLPKTKDLEMLSVEKTNLQDCYILTPRVFKDDRGLFFESFNAKRFKEETGLDVDFVQDNQSISQKGALRGLHMQAGEHAQAKLVRVAHGSVLDVAVDCRPNSATFGQYIAVELSDVNNKQLFVPRGFAHGFHALTDNVIFQYKCDNYYSKESERGIIFNDPDINIDWQLEGKPLLSEKDAVLPRLKDLKL